MSTVYVSIGNTDDKLNQASWSKFWTMTDAQVRRYATEIYGAWVSEPTSQYQNACWGFEMPDNEKLVESLKDELAWLAGFFEQDAISWADTGKAEFIGPGDNGY